MNKSIMMGRLVQDPEIRYSEGKDGELAVANFRIAVDRKYKKNNEDTADFFRCTAFGRLAEFVEDYLIKGLKIVITGRMQNDNYTNNNGDKVYGMRLLAEEIDFAESKKAFEQRQVDEEDNERAEEKGNNRKSAKGNDSSKKTSGRSNQRSDSGNSSRGNKSAPSRSSTRHSNPDEGFGEMDEEDYGDFN